MRCSRSGAADRGRSHAHADFAARWLRPRPLDDGKHFGSARLRDRAGWVSMARTEGVPSQHADGRAVAARWVRRIAGPGERTAPARRRRCGCVAAAAAAAITPARSQRRDAQAREEAGRGQAPGRRQAERAARCLRPAGLIRRRPPPRRPTIRRRRRAPARARRRSCRRRATSPIRTIKLEPKI